MAGSTAFRLEGRAGGRSLRGRSGARRREHCGLRLYGAANDSLEAIVTSYLCPDHRDNLSQGCLIAALGSELARSDDKTRAVATAGILKFVDLIAEQYRRTKPKTAKARALVAASAMVGAVMISRIVTDPELSAAILHHTKKHVLNS